MSRGSFLGELNVWFPQAKSNSKNLQAYKDTIHQPTSSRRYELMCVRKLSGNGEIHQKYFWKCRTLYYILIVWAGESTTTNLLLTGVVSSGRPVLRSRERSRLFCKTSIICHKATIVLALRQSQINTDVVLKVNPNTKYYWLYVAYQS